MDVVKVNMDSVTVHTAPETAHIETATAHTVPGTNKTPFEPAATTHENNGEAILKDFLGVLENG